MENSKRWSELLDEIRKLEYEQNDKARMFEKERKANIRQRYAKLIEALNTGYAQDSTIKYIAELGAEFADSKAYPYLGGEPFDKIS